MARGPFGQEFYGLNDNGITFADHQRNVTPIQRFIYAIAKDHHTDDIDTSSPSGMNGAHGATQGF